MKTRKMSLIALGLVALFFSLTLEARADGGSVGLAPCETKRPAGPTIHGTVGIEIQRSDNSADVTLNWQFDGQKHVTRAHIPGPIDTQSILHAICSVLTSPYIDANSNTTTLEAQILATIGRPTSKVRITKNVFKPNGVDLDYIPQTTIQSTVADLRLHVEK